MRQDIFTDEETFRKIYDEYLENAPQASQKTRDAYDELQMWLEEYVCAVQEDTFRHAYHYGYEAAKKDGVVV